MLANGEINDNYKRLRTELEYHLQMWEWQKDTEEWKLPKSETRRYRTEKEAFFPTICTSIELEDGSKIRCPHLPAGSADCKLNECPETRNATKS